MATVYSPIPLAGVTFSSGTNTGGSIPAIFEAYLYKSLNKLEQHKLTIKLRINMRQIPSKPIPVQLDSDGKVFWTSPWTNSDWQRFLSGATAQADMWNNKFWLKSPAGYSDDGWSNFDQKSSLAGEVFRPNVRCALEVDFNATSGAHRIIDVANLNLAMLFGKPQHPGTFRSESLLYDSLDSVPWAFPYGPGPGTPAVNYVIAHEIGHAIGLDHIGVIMKTPLCELAQSLANIGKDHAPLTKGGNNSFYCYGYNQGIALHGNIMGAGDAFTVQNALPWVWAMKTLRKRNLEEWQPVTTDPGPGHFERGFWK